MIDSVRGNTVTNIFGISVRKNYLLIDIKQRFNSHSISLVGACTGVRVFYFSIPSLHIWE
jgi:hypothetical protein